MRRTKDPELRVMLAAQITQAKRDLRHLRHDVGMYAMSYTRSILPKTTWSLWARLEQILTQLGTPRTTNVWSVLQTRLAGHDSTGTSLHTRVQSQLDARARAAALATEGDG